MSGIGRRDRIMTTAIAVAVLCTLAGVQAVDATASVHAKPIGRVTPIFSPPNRPRNQPADSPIGVRIETLSNDPRGAIRIDNAPVENTKDRNGIFVAVIDRVTRGVPTDGSATYPRTAAGVNQALDLAKKWSGTGYLVAVSGAHGLPDRAAFDTFNELAVFLGVDQPGLSARERDALLNAAPFSVLGIPKGAKAASWTNIGLVAGEGLPPTSVPASPRGSLEGYLRLNSATSRYDYANDDYALFNSAAGGSLQADNVIEFKGKTYPAFPFMGTDAFHVLVVDSLTLRVLDHQVLATNGGPAPISDQAYFAAQLQKDATLTAPFPPPSELNKKPPLLVIQSIGHPHAVGRGWQDAADTIGRLGGNRLGFMGLDGTSDYSLVGSLTAGPSAVEASTALGQPGPVGGVLTRTDDSTFVPLVAGPPGGVNTELVALARRPLTSFPPFEGPGPSAAQTYIAKTLNLCDESAATCDIRKAYYLHYANKWDVKYTDLNVMRFPADSGFTQADFEAVRGRLQTEFSAVSRVKAYFEELQKPFDMAAVPGRIDLKVIGDAVLKEVNPPPDGTTAFVLGLVGKIVAVGGFLPPPASAVAAGLSATFGLAAYLVNNSGAPNLPDESPAKAAELAGDLQKRMFDTADSMTGLGLLFVSDYGKLMGAAARLNTPSWELPANPAASLEKIKLSSQQWFAEALVPVAFPWLLQVTQNVYADELTCGSNYHYWENEPRTAQMTAVTGWNDAGEHSYGVIFFSRVVRWSDRDDYAPSARLASLLFDKPDQHDGALGLTRAAFMSPRVFGQLRAANQGARWCDLPH